MPSSRPLIASLFRLPVFLLLVFSLLSTVVASDAPQEARLDDFSTEGFDWKFSKGNEFPGAKGALEIAKDAGPDGKPALRLLADLTGGGKYVGLGKLMPTWSLRDTLVVRMKIKTGDVKNLTFCLTDATGQTFQKKDLPIKTDGVWHDYEFTTKSLTSGEHWGGANDGEWHGPARDIFFSITERALPETRKGEIFFADLRASVIPAGDLPALSYLGEGFDGAALPAQWTTKGDVALAADTKFSGKSAVILKRSRENFSTDTSVTSPKIAVRSGRAEFSGAFKSALEAPDASFYTTVEVEALDGSDKVLDTVKVVTIPGTSNWMPVKKAFSLPAGTIAARLRVQLNKATGSFWADDLRLSAPEVKFAPRNPVQRVLLKTAITGNMFYPGQPAVFDVTIQSATPLEKTHSKLLTWITDYWGAEQSAVSAHELTAAGRNKEFFEYKAQIALSGFTPETGKYYELRTSMDGGAGDAVRESSAFVFLPEAVTKQYSWRDVPFSSRNWDNRFPAYFEMSDRIGIRLVGVWGSWQSAPPYKASAPGMDQIKKLNLTMLTRTPIVDVEHHRKGYEAYTDEVMRAGWPVFFEKIGKDREFVITLGNEPQTSGPSVDQNVELYKLMYEQIKKDSPNTFIVGTSVGPAEEYFKRGFHKYSDAVDFHTYEDSKGLRDIFAQYKKLFAQYGGEQPIWATEMGLNAQGLSRRVVAAELIKKFSWFFSFGGQSGSWFGICYPDREGKLRGTSEDAFNLFDGLYGNYSPRLDAVAYYNVVNGICIKKFSDHREYADGLHGFLFLDKNGENLQILWKDHGAEDVRIPLSAQGPVKLTRLDGTSVALDAAKGGLDLRIGEDPVLLTYKGVQKSLPETLGSPAAKVVSAPDKIVRGDTFSVTLKTDKKDLQLSLPPGWKAGPLTTKGGNVVAEITAPANTDARFVPIRFLHQTGDLELVVPVQGQISAQINAVVLPDGRPAAELVLHNNNAKPEEVNWNLALLLQVAPKVGLYSLTNTEPPGAYFGEAADGKVTLPANGETRLRIPLENIDPITSYKVRATVTDQSGRTLIADRFLAGFVAVPKVRAAVSLDGKLDEADWSRASVRKIDRAEQFRHLLPSSKWTGLEDLSAELRFLWDDRHLYIAITTRDDVFHNESMNTEIWRGDGVQLLIDPVRSSADKKGKYDYALGKNANGTTAWCYLTADGKAPAGEVKEIVVTASSSGKGKGGMTYEIAIPWSRLIPFTPAPGANLGMAVILNEDDEPKRDGFMTWFGDIQSKEVDTVGDLILQP
ncbi:MAG: sugar-binding protein [Opitutaceae bacterium]|jgi:hypothetical protein